MIDIGVPPNICPCKLSWLRALVSCSIWYQLKKKLCLNPFNFYCFWSRLWLWLWPPFKFHKELLIGSAGDFAKFWVSNYVREKRLLCSNCIVIIQHDLNKVTCRVASPLIVFFPPTHPFGKTKKKIIWSGERRLPLNGT